MRNRDRPVDEGTSPLSSVSFELETQVERFRRVRQRAGGNQIDAGLGALAHGLERRVAAALGERAARDPADGFVDSPSRRETNAAVMVAMPLRRWTKFKDVRSPVSTARVGASTRATTSPRLIVAPSGRRSSTVTAGSTILNVSANTRPPQT